MPNHVSVVIYSLAYHQRFCELGIQELWVKFGIEDERRNIPTKWWKELFDLAQAYFLTGCDETSKIGTKVSVVASKLESYLEDFVIKPLRDFGFV